MLFNSYVFIFGYLPVILAGFFLLAKCSRRLAALWLTAASLFFSGWLNPAFVALVMVSITVNYAFGYAIGHARLKSTHQARVVLTFAVAANLGLLAYFKYVNFFIATTSQLAGIEIEALDIVLPLGISFYTFTQIAFLVDVYRGIAREYNFIHYILFVTYFPHLIAGPVLHHKQMMPQFGYSGTYRINTENINIGFTIFIIGLVKKVLLADQFALYANPIYDVTGQTGDFRLIEAWIGALAYTLQLYFDFSGYSDMAIGLSRMFNIKLPLNFDSPYKAPNIIEFWRRWHMTLSAFLRDYLYIPLGGNRKGGLRRYANLMITMLLGGLWHGAGWTFVLWGGLHGLYLVINHVWRRLTGAKSQSSVWREIVGTLLTFAAVVIAWVPFRASDMNFALKLWAGMFGLNGISLPQHLELKLSSLLGSIAVFDGIAPISSINSISAIGMIGVGLGVIWFLPSASTYLCEDKNATKFSQFIATVPQGRTIYSLVLSFVFLGCLAMFERESPFLYFQF